VSMRSGQFRLMFIAPGAGAVQNAALIGFHRANETIIAFMLNKSPTWARDRMRLNYSTQHQDGERQGRVIKSRQLFAL